MIRRSLAAAGAAVLLLSVSSAALGAPPKDPLPRPASLGVAAVQTPPEVAARLGERRGAYAQQVFPGQTGEALGVRAGDVILSVDGKPTPTPAELVASVRGLSPGKTVTLRVWRDGAERTLTGKALERPKESYAGAVTTYGAVPFQGGHLRDILVMPAGKPGAPVVFLIQGYTCASIDYANPETAHRKLVSALVARGIGVYRVEKPGVGDSRGTPRCLDTDFDVEMAGFEAAYAHLEKVHGVGSERTFLLGHSMGGVQAPLLAARRSPRGVAVFGTVVKNWHDYHFDLLRTQQALMGTGGAAEGEERAERLRDLVRRFYLERRSLASLAAESPENDRLLREVFGWEGGPMLLDRHETFWHDLAHLRLAAAWRDTKSRVLSLYGGSDLVALTGEDQRYIEVIVNGYRPGTAKFVELPGVGHGMDPIGTPAEIRARARAGEPPLGGGFSPEVATTLIAWIEESMRLPPVA